VTAAAALLEASAPPRIAWSPPRVSSAGPECIALAEVAGLILDPWERDILTDALGIAQCPHCAPGFGLACRDHLEKWAAFEVALIVSRQNGKGSILEARELAGLFLFGEQQLIHTAHEFKTARKAFVRIRRLIESTPELDRKVGKIAESHGEEGIELTRKWGGGRLDFIARSGGSGRGFTGDFLAYDEAMILAASAVAASLPTLSARTNATVGGPQVWYMGSAGLTVKGVPISTQLARVRRRALAGGDRSLMFAEYSIDPHTRDCDPDCNLHDEPHDRASWFRSNPALGVMRYRVDHGPDCKCGGRRLVPCKGLVREAGIGLTVEAVEREEAAMDEEAFANERLGVGTYPAATDGWAVIPRGWWDRTVLRDKPWPDRPAFGIDSTPDRAMTSIAVCGALDGERRYVEITDHDPGISWVIARAAAMDKRWSPLGWAIDPRSAAGALIGKLEEAGLNVITPNATEFGHGCGQFFDAARDELLWHADDKDMLRALAGAAKRNLSGQWAWDRVNSAVDISPLCAETLAHWLFLKTAEAANYDAAESVHFDLDEVVRLCDLGAYGPMDIERLYRSGILDAAGLTELAHRGVAVPAGLS
jgi:hypothetical protein